MFTKCIVVDTCAYIMLMLWPCLDVILFPMLFRMLQHENLVRLYGVCTKCSPILILTEYMRNGNHFASVFLIWICIVLCNITWLSGVMISLVDLQLTDWGIFTPSVHYKFMYVLNQIKLYYEMWQTHTKHWEFSENNSAEKHKKHVNTNIPTVI